MNLQTFASLGDTSSNAKTRHPSSPSKPQSYKQLFPLIQQPPTTHHHQPGFGGFSYISTCSSLHHPPNTNATTTPSKHASGIVSKRHSLATLNTCLNPQCKYHDSAKTQNQHAPQADAPNAMLTPRTTTLPSPEHAPCKQSPQPDHTTSHMSTNSTPPLFLTDVTPHHHLSHHTKTTGYPGASAKQS
jgi:hypothetical protein